MLRGQLFNVIIDGYTIECKVTAETAATVRLSFVNSRNIIFVEKRYLLLDNYTITGLHPHWLKLAKTFLITKRNQLQ
jgi:hypothetical protein